MKSLMSRKGDYKSNAPAEQTVSHLKFHQQLVASAGGTAESCIRCTSLQQLIKIRIFTDRSHGQCRAVWTIGLALVSPPGPLRCRRALKPFASRRAGRALHRTRTVRCARRRHGSWPSSAINDKTLARAVADHKSVFFAEKNTRSEVVDNHAAVAGGLQLVPGDNALTKLAADY